MVIYTHTIKILFKPRQFLNFVIFIFKYGANLDKYTTFVANNCKKQTNKIKTKKQNKTNKQTNKKLKMCGNDKFLAGSVHNLQSD